MDYKLNGLLSHCVFVLMLLEVQWRPVFPASIQTSCDDNVNKTKDLTKLLRREANELWDNYTKFHGYVNGSAPGDVPDSTISGINISEKLQDIYIKNVLFHLHILNVEKYQKELWSDPQSVKQLLSHVKHRLSHLLGRIKALMTLHLEIPLPTTPAPPQLSHEHDFTKKAYGSGVIVRLKDWLTEVLQVLMEMKICDREQGQS